LRRRRIAAASGALVLVSLAILHGTLALVVITAAGALLVGDAVAHRGRATVLPIVIGAVAAAALVIIASSL
jgi:hypothetical protein